VLIGLAITVANVAIPVVIGRDLPRWSGTVLGVCTAALNVGSMITLSCTVPIADVSGWRMALLAWGAQVLGGLAVWWYATRHRARWVLEGADGGQTRRAAAETIASGGVAWPSGASRPGSPVRPSPTTG
jgi:CP family cyanate transporter-like MFS transporter